MGWKGPRPTEAEFEELKHKRDEGIARIVKTIAEKNGWDASTVRVHASHTAGCYCACPDGPCQHEWNGERYISEDQCMESATCSRCGSIAMYHDMRVFD